MTSRIGRLLFAGAVLLAPAPAARAELAGEADPTSIDALLKASTATGPIVARPPVFTEDDQLLFAVTAESLQLSDSFEGYSSRAGVFLPIGALARLIDINLDVDPARQRARGWVVTPSRTVEVDLVNHRLVVGGVESHLSEADAVVRDGDIYMRTAVIEKLLPIKISADVPGLNLAITPTEKLPFQERLERELRASQLGGAAQEGQPLLVPDPYRLFTPPSVDVNLNLGAGNHTPKTTGSFDVRVAGDLAGAGLQLFAGSDSDFDLTSARILLSRKDPEGKQAGPFRATRSSLGDTFTPTLTVGARSSSGRGLAITSVPLEQASVFDRIDLRGELPLGYQVELYVNEVLRGSQTQPVQGRYEFQQVSLAYGLNVIRLVFYGPRGERREDVRRINVGGGQLKAGQTTYSFGAVQEALTVFGLGDDKTRIGVPGGGEWRVSGQISHGLTDMTTLVAGYGRYTPFVDDTRQMGSLGLVTSIGGGAAQLDAAADDQGGGALVGGYATRIGKTSLVAKHGEYRGGFVDETQSAGTSSVPLERSSSLSIDTLIGLFGANVPASFRVARDEFADGATDVRFDARVSRPVGRYLVSNALSYEHRDLATGSTDDVVNGNLDVSGLVGGKWQIRAGAAYTTTPKFKVSSAGLSADRNFGDRNALHLGVTQVFDPDDTRFEVGETWRLKQADISLISAYATRSKDFRMGLNISVGFGYDPWRRGYHDLGPGVASGGSMAVEAFVDDNGNGRRDPGERPLPDLVIQGGRMAQKTDKDGRALITGLGDGAYGQASIDVSSLDDPYLLPAAPAVKVVPRPGRVAEIPFPVAVSGEVELHVLFQRPGESTRGISALHLELVGPDGKVVAAGSSEFDGTLLIDNVKPGTYQVRIEAAQAQRLKMVLVRPVTVAIKPGGGFTGRVDVPVTTTATPVEAGAGK